MTDHFRAGVPSFCHTLSLGNFPLIFPAHIHCPKSIITNASIKVFRHVNYPPCYTICKAEQIQPLLVAVQSLRAWPNTAKLRLRQFFHLRKNYFLLSEASPNIGAAQNILRMQDKATCGPSLSPGSSYTAGYRGKWSHGNHPRVPLRGASLNKPA